MQQYFSLDEVGWVHRSGRAKRKYVNDKKTRDLMKHLVTFCELEVQVPRMKIVKRQTVETLISEESLLFAKYLRNDRKTWKPGITVLQLMEIDVKCQLQVLRLHAWKIFTLALKTNCSQKARE